jgi:broad specificity phosphatase PhoE
MVGWTDRNADLSDTGTFQALRDHLPNAPVVSSDLSRAIDTADTLAASRPRLPHDPRLREIHFGDWEDMAFDAVTDTDRIRAFWETPGAISAPNGESWDMLCERVNAAADDLVSHGHPDIIVVAHFGAILCQIQRAKQITAYDAFGQKVDNLSVTVLTFEHNWQAVMVNSPAKNITEIDDHI